jgi:hypothetical protein
MICYLNSVKNPKGGIRQAKEKKEVCIKLLVEKISCSTLFPRKFYSFKAEFEVFSERNPLLSVVKVQFLAWLSLFPLLLKAVLKGRGFNPNFR